VWIGAKNFQVIEEHGSKLNQTFFSGDTLLNTLENRYGLTCIFGCPIYVGTNGVVYVELPIHMAKYFDTIFIYYHHCGVLNKALEALANMLASSETSTPIKKYGI